MAQFARPSVDTTNATWTASSGSNLYAAIGESTRDDTVYILSQANASPSVYVTKLSSIYDPLVSTGHILRYTYRRSATNKNGTLVVELRQGYVNESSQGTLIRTDTYTNPAATFSLATITLTAGQADAITDYSDLYLRFSVTVNAGGGLTLQSSWAELETPNATVYPQTLSITSGIASAGAFPTNLIVSVATVQRTAQLSWVRLDADQAQVPIQPTGIASAEAFGALQVRPLFDIFADAFPTLTFDSAWDYVHPSQDGATGVIEIRSNYGPDGSNAAYLSVTSNAAPHWTELIKYFNNQTSVQLSFQLWSNTALSNYFTILAANRRESGGPSFGLEYGYDIGYRYWFVKADGTDQIAVLSGISQSAWHDWKFVYETNPHRLEIWVDGVLRVSYTDATNGSSVYPVGALDFQVGNSDTLGNQATIELDNIDIQTYAGYLRPVAVGSAEVFGSATVSSGAGAQILTPTSVASTENLLAPQLGLGAVAVLEESGIASGEALGNPVLLAIRILQANPLDSLEGLGLATLLLGPAPVLPDPVLSLEAFGSGTAALPQARLLSPAPLGSPEQFGQSALQSGPVSLLGSSIPPAAQFENPQVSVGTAFLEPASIDSWETFTLPALSGALLVFPSSVASLEAFALPELLLVGLALVPASIASLEQLPAPLASAGAAHLLAYSIPGQDSVSAPSLQPGSLTCLPSGFGTTEAFDSPTLIPSAVAVATVAIDSLAAFDIPLLQIGPRQLQPDAVASLETFAAAQLHHQLGALEITSLESWGAPLLIPGSVLVSAQSMASAAALGVPVLNTGSGILQPASLLSLETFETPLLSAAGISILPAAIGSGEYWGDTNVSAGIHQIVPDPIGPLESFGTAALTSGTVLVSPVALAGAETFAPPELWTMLSMLPESLASQETWGTPAVSPGWIGVAPDGIGSAEIFEPARVSLRSTFVSPGSIPTAETWNLPVLGSGSTYVLPASINGAELVGSPRLAVAIGALSITSEELFGATTLQAGWVLLQPIHIPSLESFGSTSLQALYLLLPVSVVDATLVADPWIQPGVCTLQPAPAGSGEAFGSALLSSGGSWILQDAGVAGAEAFGLGVLYSNLPRIDIAVTVEVLRSLSDLVEVTRAAGDTLTLVRSMQDTLEV